MIKILIPIAALALAASASATAAAPGGSDYSACGSAIDAKDPHQRISLYTTCLKHGGVGGDATWIFYNRASAYQLVGEVEKAFQDFNSSIQYDPTWPNPYVGRAGIESARGLCNEARADMDKAMKMGPPRAPFLNQAAWILATCADPAARDGRRAIELAQQALKVREDSTIRDTLAAAYAEEGQFDLAQAEEVKAIKSAGEQPARLESMQARLELYSHGLAFHTRPVSEAATANGH